MKGLVAYYSRFGNTARVADSLLESLRRENEADIVEIEYSGKKNIFTSAFYRFFPMFVKLSPVKYDLKDYDLLCLGIPVWAGRPSAPVTKYLLLLKNTRNKKAVCLYVYGFEASAKRCSSFVGKILRRKGFVSVKNVFIHWDKIGDDVFVRNSIAKALK